mmetsp:Transcript_3839/g.11749  ORF Transcript_3839/g.11749 Transcript_3839/m.11749 type:complete len:136 (-) Transcript_3839:6529-6936(-)
MIASPAAAVMRDPSGHQSRDVTSAACACTVKSGGTASSDAGYALNVTPPWDATASVELSGDRETEVTVDACEACVSQLTEHVDVAHRTSLTDVTCSPLATVQQAISCVEEEALRSFDSRQKSSDATGDVNLSIAA